LAEPGLRASPEQTASVYCPRVLNACPFFETVVSGTGKRQCYLYKALLFRGNAADAKMAPIVGLDGLH
jgi:hypothetical protein